MTKNRYNINDKVKYHGKTWKVSGVEVVDFDDFTLEYTLDDDERNAEVCIPEKDLEPVINDTMDKSDVINHPSHYTQGIECMDYIESHRLNYARGNVIKYVTRAGLKDKSKTVEDLKKARWYLDREIRNMEKKDSESQEGE